MHPAIEAILFLLREAHASGNYPEGHAAAHIKAIEESMQEHSAVASADTASTKPQPEKESEPK